MKNIYFFHEVTYNYLKDLKMYVNISLLVGI